MDRRAFLLATLATAGCSAVPRLPDRETLYAYVRDQRADERRPLVGLPGTLGSRLRIGQDGPFIWGGPRRLSLDPDGNAEDARRLALPIGNGDAPLSTLRDAVRTDGVLRRANARILGTTIEEQVYDGLVRSLNAGGYDFSETLEEERARRGENPGSLEFPFDWRRDIVEAARDLDAFIERKAIQVNRVRTTLYGDAEPAETMRFDFIAHSMGTLVLRYWLMYGAQDLPEDGSLPELTWAGARRAACAIFVAPPNLGSISALTSIIEGRSFGPLQPSYPPALVGTHVSVYQLMARTRHARARLGSMDGPSAGDLFDPDLWDASGWGMLDPEQADVLAALLPAIPTRAERHARAKRHLAQILRRSEQFQRAMDRPGTPRGTDMFLVVGTGFDTPASAVIDPDTGRVNDVIYEEGDGVVLRASALHDERQGGYTGPAPRRPIRYRTTLLLPGEHVELTHSPVFADNLLYWLLDNPRARTNVATTPRSPGSIGG